jgi:hypothetical protein
MSKKNQTESKPKRTYTKRKKSPNIIEISDTESDKKSNLQSTKKVETKEKQYFGPCPVRTCRGFIESNLKCGICENDDNDDISNVILENKIVSELIQIVETVPSEVGETVEEIRKTMKLSQFCVCLSYNENNERITVKTMGMHLMIFILY